MFINLVFKKNQKWIKKHIFRKRKNAEKKKNPKNCWNFMKETKKALKVYEKEV